MAVFAEAHLAVLAEELVGVGQVQRVVRVVRLKPARVAVPAAKIQHTSLKTRGGKCGSTGVF